MTLQPLIVPQRTELSRYYDYGRRLLHSKFDYFEGMKTKYYHRRWCEYVDKSTSEGSLLRIVSVAINNAGSQKYMYVGGFRNRPTAFHFGKYEAKPENII